MKKFLITIFYIVLFGNINAQTKVTNFYSAMTSDPIGKKILYMNVIYKNGEYDSIEKKLIKNWKPSKKEKYKYVLKGKIIDSLELINYKKDTIYILGVSFLGVPSEDIYKTSKDIFFFVKDEQQKYQIEYTDKNLNKDYSFSERYQKISDSIENNAMFSWNLNKLIKLIKASGEPSGSEHDMSITRIMLNNYKITKKEYIYFRPIMIDEKEIYKIMGYEYVPD